MKVILSGGQFGGQIIDWPENTKIVSIFYVNVYYNYDVEIHNDTNLRADFCGCSEKEQGTVVAILAE